MTRIENLSFINIFMDNPDTNIENTVIELQHEITGIYYSAVKPIESNIHHTKYKLYCKQIILNVRKTQANLFVITDSLEFIDTLLEAWKETGKNIDDIWFITSRCTDDGVKY